MTIQHRIAVGFENYASSFERTTEWGWEQLPYALTSFAISFGAIILVAIIAQTSMCMLSNRKRKRTVFWSRSI
jgi:hypothetical protein